MAFFYVCFHFLLIRTFDFLCLSSYNAYRTYWGCLMIKKKYHIALDDFERRIVVNCLNEMRNELISKGKYTEDLGTILLKVIDAKTKRFRVIYKEA